VSREKKREDLDSTDPLDQPDQASNGNLLSIEQFTAKHDYMGMTVGLDNFWSSLADLERCVCNKNKESEFLALAPRMRVLLAAMWDRKLGSFNRKLKAEEGTTLASLIRSFA